MGTALERPRISRFDFAFVRLIAVTDPRSTFTHGFSPYQAVPLIV